MARPTKSNADYFKHDSDMRNDPKIKALRVKFGLAGYALWNMILETLADAEGFCIPWDEQSIELYAGDFVSDAETLVSAAEYMKKVKLIQVEGEKLWCPKLSDRLSSVIEKRFLMQEKYLKRVSDAETPVSDAETTQSRVEKSRVNKKEKNAHEARDDFFEKEEGEGKEKSPPIPAAPPIDPPPDDLHLVRQWAAKHLDELRGMASTAGFEEGHGSVSDNITLFCSHYAMSEDYRRDPLDFFRSKFSGWLVNAKGKASRPKRNGKAPAAAVKETPPPSGGYTPEFVTTCFKSRYGMVSESLTNQHIQKLIQAPNTETLSTWMEGIYERLKNGAPAKRLGLMEIGAVANS